MKAEAEEIRQNWPRHGSIEERSELPILRAAGRDTSESSEGGDGMVLTFSWRSSTRFLLVASSCKRA